MSKPIALITSASGRIGKEIIALLNKDKQFLVRACCFSESKTKLLEDLGADEVVPFDLNNADTWATALDGVRVVYSASLDPMLEGHLAFCKAMGARSEQIKHVVRISCMGADTNTASYNPDKHASRKGAGIPLMLRHYWCGEKALIDAGLPVSVLRNNFFMNHSLKTDCDNIESEGWFCRCSPDFYNIMGHKPTSYYDYLTTQGVSGETGLDELWQGNLWKKGEDAMEKAAKLS